MDPGTVPDQEFRDKVQPETPSNEAPGRQFVADAVGNIFISSLNTDSAVNQEQKGNDTREAMMNLPRRKVQRETPSCEALEPQFLANTIGNIVQNLFGTNNSRDGFGASGLRADPLRMKYLYFEMGEIQLMRTYERSEPKKSWSTGESVRQALNSASPCEVQEPIADSLQRNETSAWNRDDYVDDTELD